MNRACDILSEYMSVGDGLKEMLSVVCDRLKAMNGVLNLTSLKTDEEIAMLHLYDSLTLLSTNLFHGKNVIDVGCGGGFPALPLAAATDCTVTANDATAKKLKFVEETAREAGIRNIGTLYGRAEEIGVSGYREKFDVAVSRGVARMNVLVEWCLPLVKVGGYFVAMKGPGGRAETDEAANGIALLGGELVEIKDVQIPLQERSHTLVIIKKARPTPDGYPRQNVKIMKKPL